MKVEKFLYDEELSNKTTQKQKQTHAKWLISGKFCIVFILSTHNKEHS